VKVHLDLEPGRQGRRAADTPSLSEVHALIDIFRFGDRASPRAFHVLLTCLVDVPAECGTSSARRGRRGGRRPRHLERQANVGTGERRKVHRSQQRLDDPTLR